MGLKYRPKILMIADKPDWAYDHICDFVINMLRNKYEFHRDYLCFQKDNKKNRININFIKKIVKLNFYKIKCLNKRELLPFRKNYDLICYLGWFFPFCKSFRYKSRYLIKGIYTSTFPPQGIELIGIQDNISIADFINIYLSDANAVICGSREIFNFYKPYISKLYLATGAINTKLFKPPPNQPIKAKKELVIGWGGNPNRKFKGFYDYVLPAVNKAKQLRPNIVFKTRFSGPFRTLPKFYSDIDIIVLASIGDAGPSAFIEAGACGVPAISIKAGSPKEVINHLENGIFVNRDIDEITNAIIMVYDNRDLLVKMKKNIREDIVRTFSYEVRIKYWERLFEDILGQ